MSGARAPATPRPAASLLLLRDGAAGLEVLMLRRAEREGDPWSGAAVFPGGALDAGDRAARAFCLGVDDAAASARLGLAADATDYLVAALRECFEEVGLLLAARPDGTPFDAAAHADALHPWRARLAAGEADLAALCAAFDLRLDLRGLVYSAHWLTPPGVPKRFDTRFFTAAAPAGQTAAADEGEAVELMWLAPRAALDPARALKLLPVTRVLLQELAGFADTASALANAAARREVPLVMPRRALDRAGRLRIVLPHEHPYAEIARLDPDGRGDVFAEIVPGRAVRLAPTIVRVTAPNPGLMTGPGTNSYLVGAGDDWAVIDPGPDDEVHREALLAAAPGRITRIVVTHTHRDHSPGAAALAAATGARRVGLRPLHPQGQDESFVPDDEPAHGGRLVLGGGAVTLRAIHTPGHASNHVCWHHEGERLLFTGDHVMQGSTVVINPPDGDMAAYLKALEALLDEPLDWLAPGHGFVVARPHEVLRALIAHRLQREARVAAALAQVGRGTLDALLPHAYADVPAALHPVARRSLLAHLLKLQAEGHADADGDDWLATAPR